MQNLLSEILQPAPLAAGAVISAVAGHLWRRYRDRLTALTWQYAVNQIARAAAHPAFGRIEVLHNQKSVQHVAALTISIANEGTKDLQSVPVNVVFHDGTRILYSSAEVIGSQNPVPFTPDYAKLLERYHALEAGTAEKTALESRLSQRRDYQAPVINRGGRMTMQFLVEGPPSGLAPLPVVASDYVGVAVRRVAAPPTVKAQLFGVAFGEAAIAGLALAAIGLPAVIALDLAPTALSISSFLIGGMGGVLGAALIRCVRLLGKLLS